MSLTNTRGVVLMVALAMPIGLVACGSTAPSGGVTMTSNEALQSDLARVRVARVLFAHQSVGANIIEGVRALTDRLGVEPLRIVSDATGARTLANAGVFVEIPIGNNGDPISKFEAFRVMINTAPARFDVVALKLCYADFGPTSDPAQLFDAYRRAIASATSGPAAPTVLHVTTPLRTRSPAWKVFVKSMLRRPADVRNAENLKRAEYNALLRRGFAGEPLFDLAAIESGLSAGVTSDGAVTPDGSFALLDQYTDDGGHLNAAGRQSAARAFVHALAAAVGSARRHVK